MFNRYLRMGSVAIITALTGCASLPGADSSATDVRDTPVRSHVEFRHALPVAAETEDEIVAGSVNVAAPSGLIDYGARYEIQAGKLFEALREGDGDLESARDEVALQTMAQKLGSSVPLPAGGPLRLEVTNRERSRLGNGDARRSRSTRAALQWSPGPVDLKLRWSAPRGQLPSRTADCNLRAGLELPASFMPVASSSTFELSSQRCRIRAPEAGPAEVALERWGAAWSWSGRHATSVHVLRTEPEVPLGHPAGLTPDYELGFSHSRALPGGWQTTTKLSMLRSDAYEHDHATSAQSSATDWSADLALTRELDLMAITARWASAAERLWLATATSPVTSDRFSLALDFGAWLGRAWPRLRTDMDLSWDWRETRSGESDSKVSWNLLIGW